jgi:hypothetical protein
MVIITISITHMPPLWGPGASEDQWRIAPSMMSDWQCCVDWLFTKYCRYRLQLDSCWCRWRISTKGLCRGGLRERERQVGLVPWTRWLMGSSVSRAVQERQDEVVDVEPGLSWWLSQEIGVEVVRRSRGLHWFGHKPLGSWLIHKAKTRDSAVTCLRQTGLTGGPD